MLELVPFGLTGLAAIVFVAFYFACKDHATSFSDKLSPSLMCDAEFRPPKPLERRACAADDDVGPRVRNTRGL
jgi:hypothetical protein